MLSRNQGWVLAQLQQGNPTLNMRPSDMAAGHLDAAVEQCEAAGWIVAAGRRGPRRMWALTAAGRALIAPPQDVVRDVYRPPAQPPRRPGADDWQRLPSMAAGMLR